MRRSALLACTAIRQTCRTCRIKNRWERFRREKELEAAPGFEPGNKGFAGLRLTTWLCRLRSCPLYRSRAKFVKSDLEIRLTGAGRTGYTQGLRKWRPFRCDARRAAAVAPLTAWGYVQHGQ